MRSADFPTDDYHGAEDWAFWVLAEEAGWLAESTVVQVPGPLYHHRMRKGNLTSGFAAH